jgi:hypothetical protein
MNRFWKKAAAYINKSEGLRMIKGGEAGRPKA